MYTLTFTSIEVIHKNLANFIEEMKRLQLIRFVWGVAQLNLLEYDKVKEMEQLLKAREDVMKELNLKDI